ncbi:MAG TPA: hypothetical protein VLC28_02120 [Flavitalea sp.]|nr:hypothetical protein [Flavitalea sp.]
MKNERSSQLVLFFIICTISILHGIKLREQRYSRTDTLNQRLIVTIPGAASIIHPAVSSLSSNRLPAGN